LRALQRTMGRREHRRGRGVVGPLARTPRRHAAVVVKRRAVAIACAVLLASLGKQRAVRGVIALVAAFLLVVQIVFFRYYHVFLDDHALAAARHMWGDVRPTVMRVLPSVIGVSALASVLEYEALTFGGRVESAIGRGILGAVLV